MKGNRKLEPTQELLDKVIFLANAKAKLPISERAQLDVWGVYCRVNQLPGGALLYQAGGKFIPRLRFVAEASGSIRVRKYQPGDWERNLARTYDFHARFRPEGLERAKEMDELLAAAQDTEEKIRRLEQKASKVPNQANYWSTASVLVGWYREVGRFRDAEKTAIAAVEAWPNQFVPHLELGLLYFITVLNTKRSKIGEANERFIRKYGVRTTELTPETLGYSYERVRILAEKYLVKAVEVAPPALKNAPRKILAELRAIDKAPGLSEFEEAVRERPDSASAWSALSWKYMEVGKFKAAEKAASTALSLAPGVAQLHFDLSTIYFGALAKSKEVRPNSREALLVEELRLKDPSLAVPVPLPNDLTLDVLECDYEYALKMVETHANETIRLTKDERLRRAAEEQLANLKLLSQM